jgi:hypothetical protein
MTSAETIDEKKKKKKTRLPRSLRKHVRRAKAALRREHTAADAEKAIEQLVTRLRKSTA